MQDDEFVNNVINQESEKNPEVFKVLQNLTTHKKPIWYKNRNGEFEKADFHKSDHFWTLNIRMRNGVPRLMIEIFKMEDVEWHNEHLPAFNYFPPSFVLEDYGDLWKIEE